MPSAARGAEYLVYVGTYTNGAGKGIYSYRFDTGSGKITPLGVAVETPNPSYLIADAKHRFVYAANESGNRGGEPGNTVSAFAVDSKTGKLTLLNKISTRGGGPCHLALDHTGRWIVAANYNTGSTAVLPVASDGKLDEAAAFVQHEGSGTDPRRQRGPHAHCALFAPDNRFLMVADLGLDKVLVYAFDPAKGSIVAANSGAVAPGAGVRHLAFHPNGKVLYTINELGSTLTAFNYNAKTGALAEFQTVSSLPPGVTGQNSTAEVQVNRAGTVLYGSNRGHDSIAVFSIDPKKFTLSPIEDMPTQGRTPRFFTLDPTGQYLFAANQDGNNVVVFKVDAKTGKLTPTGQTITDAASPVCVLFVPAS
jgi:6-phosphogluconolactonase